jgi:IS5 family transposase
MLRTQAVAVSVWEAVLPEDVLRLPEELAHVEALLDARAFFGPVRGVLRPEARRAIDADADISG